MQLTVLSWNIWIDGHFKEIQEFLEQSDADIIGLQEVKDDDPSRDIIGYLTSRGYDYVFAPVEKVWDGEVFRDGPAVFSKHPILKKETYILSDVNSRAAARADLQIGESVLHVFSTHLVHTHQQPSAVQELQVENLLKLIPPQHSIVMGDFNATPDSKAIRKVSEALTDTDPSAAPTWSVYPEGCGECKPQSLATRLDYIFVSKDLKAHSFMVGESKASDHLPISAVLEL